MGTEHPHEWRSNDVRTAIGLSTPVRKQPYFVGMRDEQLLVFAGLFYLFLIFLGCVQTSSNNASFAVSGSISSHFVGEEYLLYSSFMDR